MMSNLLSANAPLGHHNVHDHYCLRGDDLNHPVVIPTAIIVAATSTVVIITPTTTPVLVVPSITVVIGSRIVWTFIYNIRVIANLTKVEAGLCSLERSAVMTWSGCLCPSTPSHKLKMSDM